MQKQRAAKGKTRIIFRWIGWVLLVQFLLINISSALYAYKFTHFRDGVPPAKPHSNIFFKTWRYFTGPDQYRIQNNDRPSFPVETVHLATAGGLQLEGWYAPADSTPKGTVIVLHGITTGKAQVIPEAGEFRFWGYNILMIDFRAHGNSQGNTTTIGVREVEDVKLAYDFVRARGEKKIIFYGLSMGATTCMKAIRDYHLQPAGVVFEAPFLSLQTYYKARARLAGFPQQPFAFLTTFWTGVEQGFNGYRHSAVNYAPAVQCPTLIQWGKLDAFVPGNDVTRIFEAIGSTDKKLVVYETVHHESFVLREPEKWRREVGAFLTTIP